MCVVKETIALVSILALLAVTFWFEHEPKGLVSGMVVQKISQVSF